MGRALKEQSVIYHTECRQSERVTRLETHYEDIKEDVLEIKNGIKDLISSLSAKDRAKKEDFKWKIGIIFMAIGYVISAGINLYNFLNKSGLLSKMFHF